MPNNRSRKVGVGGAYSSTTKVVTSRCRPTEVTHVLVRELSTQKLVNIEINSLSDATRLKPLTVGRNASYRDGNSGGQKQGEIVFVGKSLISNSSFLAFHMMICCSSFLLGTHGEVSAEMNNHTRIDSTESPQKRRRQDDSPEQSYNDKRRSIPYSSIPSNVVETRSIRSPSPLQAPLSQDFAFRLPTPTLSALNTTTTVSNSLLSNCSTTVSNEITMEDNVVDTTASAIMQQPLSSTLPPLITTTPTNSTNRSLTRTVVPSTTITRKTTPSNALNELKRLRLLLQSKDEENKKLTEQIKKLKKEAERNAQYSICT
jgi:hypothetical protein